MPSIDERNSVQPPDMDSGIPTPEHAIHVPPGVPANGAGIGRWQDLRRVSESFDTDENGNSVYSHCSFLYLDADYAAYFYQSTATKRQVTLEAVRNNLARIPDHEIYPEVSAITTTHAQAIGAGLWLKNTAYTQYEESMGQDFLAKLCLGEALVYEILARSPHRNITRYHGCIVRRGRIIGMVLDRHHCTLFSRVEDAQDGGLDIDPDSYIKAIASGVEHLHSLGLAHNDLNPNNIMLDASGNPVIIDFGSCRPLGSEVMTCGTPGWFDQNDEFVLTSTAEHDVFSLGKIEAWLREKVSLLRGG